MGQAGVMHIPAPLRAAVGLVVTAADEARRLPDRALELPMLAVSTALQASVRAQQRYARLTARGDALLNRRPPKAEYVRRPEELEWLPGALDALRLFRDAGYRVVVVSNQAGIARGAMSEADLAAVHERMLRDTEEAGGHIDAIYHCPHGWDDGCECRKPRPGMLFHAQRDFTLDLTRTVFVGDDERDAEAADAAGCLSAQVTETTSLLDVTRRMLEGALVA